MLALVPPHLPTSRGGTGYWMCKEQEHRRYFQQLQAAPIEPVSIRTTPGSGVVVLWVQNRITHFSLWPITIPKWSSQRMGLLVLERPRLSRHWMSGVILCWRLVHMLPFLPVPELPN